MPALNGTAFAAMLRPSEVFLVNAISEGAAFKRVATFSRATRLLPNHLVRAQQQRLR